MYQIPRSVTSKYGAYVRSIQGCSSSINVKHCSDNRRREEIKAYDDHSKWKHRRNACSKKEENSCNSLLDNNLILLYSNINGRRDGSYPTLASASNRIFSHTVLNNFIIQRHSFHTSAAFLAENSKEKLKVLDQIHDDKSNKVEDFVEHQKKKVEIKEKIISASERYQRAFVYKIDPALAEPSRSLDAAKPHKAKVAIITKIVNEVKHYYNGFRLLYLDTKIAARLLWRTMNGKSLSRRESKQFRRTVSDLFRLVPFSIFIIIPFMEFLLPVAIKLFPGMLPSTFENAKSKEDKRRVSLKKRLEMAEFLQDTIEEISVTSEKKGTKKPNEKLIEFAGFVSKTKTGTNPPTNGEIMKYSKLFEDEITLENLPYDQLKALCRMMMISPIGLSGFEELQANFLRIRLRYKLIELKKDDQIIRREGIDNLSSEELQLACSTRGMRSLGLPINRLKSNLKQWLELSLDQNIPASLLLLSRTFYMQYDQVEQLKLTISQLPERVIDEMELKIAAVEGEVVDRQTIIDIIKHEEEEIKVEKAKKDAEILEIGVKGVKEDKLSKEELLKVKETLSRSEREKLEEIKEEREDYKEDVEEMKLVNKEAVESKASTRLGKRLDGMLSRLEKSLQKIEHNVSDLQSGKIDQDQDGIVTTRELEQAINALRNAPDEAKAKRLIEVIDEDKDGVIDLEEMRMAVKLLATEDLDLSEPQVTEVLALLKNTERILVNEHILNREKTNYLTRLLPTVYSRKNLDNS